jgi:hypothetical protein
MSHSFKLSRRIARFRLPAVAFLLATVIGCDNGNSFNSETTSQPGTDEFTPADPMTSIDEDTPVPAGSESDMTVMDASTASLSFAGGIPMGNTGQPNGAFGSIYNGALRNIYPQYLLSNLSAIKSRGGKIVLMMAGPDFLYKDADGHFSLSKWKARIDRFRTVNFSSYITDGTIIGHYMIDEPNDPTNWNGVPVPGSTVDAMAQYSKSIWPTMATIARVEPGYLERWAPYRYLDAAWAQYVYRFGDVDKFIDTHVASAKRQGLGLVVGLNVLKGGPNKSRMSASQVRSWGSTLLSSTYPCAFINWKYDSYLTTSSMKDAMNALRNKAESRSARSCRAT